MDWFYPKRRGPEWKQGWTVQTLTSISTPPLPLLAVFAIVIFLLSLSQYTSYKAQMAHTKMNFQLFIFLLPILLMFMVLPGLTSLKFGLRALQPENDPARKSGGSPWGVAILVVVLLLLVSYQSSFHSLWFGSA